MSHDTHVPHSEKALPKGMDFFELIWQTEERCLQHTDQILPTMGRLAPILFTNLGTSLSLLYRMGSCAWGCRGGDHIIEYISGRCCTTALAAIRLLKFGYYDETLALARNIGEAANLLTLFNLEAASLIKWQAADERARRSEFSPVKVRLALESLGLQDLGLINQDRYGHLSAIATHISPGTKPQTYNILGVPTLGAVFQGVGFLTALNEIAIPIGFLLPPAGKLLALPQEAKSEIKINVIDLLSSVGGIQVTDMQKILQSLGDALKNSNELTKATPEQPMTPNASERSE